MSHVTCPYIQVRMTLDEENEEMGLNLVPGTFGMNVPSACTIVIIAGMYTKHIRR